MCCGNDTLSELPRLRMIVAAQAVWPFGLARNIRTDQSRDAKKLTQAFTDGDFCWYRIVHRRS